MLRLTACLLTTFTLSLAGCCTEDGGGCLENADCCSGCCSIDPDCRYFSIRTNICVPVDEEASEEGLRVAGLLLGRRLCGG